MQFESRSVSRILSTASLAGARMGDHSSRPSVAGRLKRPTRRRGAPARSARSDGPPFARLPIWSCTARSLPGRACHQTRRCALTLSPLGPHRFPHHPLPSAGAEGPLAGLFSVALVVTRPERASQQLNAAHSPKPSAQPLTGSLPCSVRTFLSRLAPAATARPVLLQGGPIIANQCSNGYSTN